MVQIIIRMGTSSLEYQANIDTTALELKSHIFKAKKIPLIQQQLSVQKNPEERKIILKDTDIIHDYISLMQDNTLVVNFKNLGRQIEYQSLFYLEYLLPIITLPFFYILNYQKSNSYYVLITILGLFHFLKREFETAFIHVYSYPSVPWANAWRNLVHYWALFGILFPIEIYYWRTMSSSYNMILLGILVALFFIFELLNFYCHVKLRNLRYEIVDGQKILTKKRKIPKGLFFDSIIAPNYTFEVLSWVSFTVISRSYVMVLFTGFSATIMYLWAKKKKSGLIKNNAFSDDEKNMLKKRYAIFPGI